MITGSAPPFAIPIGALFSGALMTIPGVTPTLGYSLLGILLVIFAVLLYMCRDSVTPRPGALRSTRPQIRIPDGMGRIIFAAGAAFAATWSLGGFFQAFAASVTADYLGSTNTFVIAVVFSSAVLLSPVGALLSGRLRPATAVRAGLTVFTLAVLGFIAALWSGSITWFLVAALIAGVGQGAASTGGMRSVLNVAPVPDRAGVLATMYLICYSSGAIPSLVVGQIADFVPIFSIAVGQGVLVVIATVVSVATIRNQPPKRF
jgi:MFS family permease